MLVLVIVLIVTNLLALAAVGYLWVRPAPEAEPLDPRVHEALAALARQDPASTRGRQFISIEILNPIELASARGRLLGLAGSVAPGLTKRVVYDQTAKEVKRQLIAQHVIADVHVHAVRATGSNDTTAAGAVRLPSDPRTLDAQAANFVDELDPPVDLPRGDQPLV